MKDQIDIIAEAVGIDKYDLHPDVEITVRVSDMIQMMEDWGRECLDIPYAEYSTEVDKKMYEAIRKRKKKRQIK